MTTGLKGYAMGCDNCGVTSETLLDSGIHPEEVGDMFEYLDGMLLCLLCADDRR